MILYSSNKEDTITRISNIFPIRVNDKIIFIGCYHGISDINKIKYNGKLYDVKTVYTSRYDFAIHTCNNITLDENDVYSFEDLYTEKLSNRDILDTGKIKYMNHSNNKYYSTTININSIKLYNEIDFISPKTLHIYTNKIKKKKLNSLSGSPLIVNNRIYGMLIKEVGDELVFLHSILIEKLINKFFNKYLNSVSIIPLKKREILLNNNTKAYYVTESNFTKDILKEDIIIGIENIFYEESDFNDQFPLDTLIMYNTEPSDEVILKILRKVEHEYITLNIKVKTYDLSKVEKIPTQSPKYTYKSYKFTNLNSKLFFDFKMKFKKLSKTIEDKITLDFSKCFEKYVVILDSKKIKPKIISNQLCLPIVLSINGVKVTNSKHMLELIKDKKQNKIEYLINNKKIISIL